jgi:hypothetical protein
MVNYVALDCQREFNTQLIECQGSSYRARAWQSGISAPGRPAEVLRSVARAACSARGREMDVVSIDQLIHLSRMSSARGVRCCNPLAIIELHPGDQVRLNPPLATSC